MLARLKGARVARGDVLIFLDAHCEGDTDWMRPLLERVKHKRDSVVTPIIDVIHQTTFEFEGHDTFQVPNYGVLVLSRFQCDKESEEAQIYRNRIVPVESTSCHRVLFSSWFVEVGSLSDLSYSLVAAFSCMKTNPTQYAR